MDVQMGYTCMCSCDHLKIAKRELINKLYIRERFNTFNMIASVGPFINWTYRLLIGYPIGYMSNWTFHMSKSNYFNWTLEIPNTGHIPPYKHICIGPSY